MVALPDPILALCVPRGETVNPSRLQFSAALIEILDHDDGVIDSNDIFECHAFVSPPSIGILG